MPLQALYLSEEVIERLKKEENMSRLVNSILHDYFELTIPLDEKFVKVKTELDKKMNEYQQLQELTLEQQEKIKQREIESTKIDGINLTKLQNKSLMRSEYEKATPKEKQSNDGFEEFCKNYVISEKEV